MKRAVIGLGKHRRIRVGSVHGKLKRQHSDHDSSTPFLVCEADRELHSSIPNMCRYRKGFKQGFQFVFQAQSSKILLHRREEKAQGNASPEPSPPSPSPTITWRSAADNLLHTYLQISFPSESSFTTTRSSPPTFVPLKFPVVRPARITELSTPNATAVTVSMPLVPS